MFKPQGWQRSARLLALMPVLLLAACGGGGGGGGGDESAAATNTNYTVTVSVLGNGTVSPSGAQQVASNGSVTFTATPAPGWIASGISASGATSCLTNANFTTNSAAGQYTVANPRNDCSFTIKFAQITHTVTAAAVTKLVPTTPNSFSVTGSPDFSVVDSSKQYLWVVDGDNDHFDGNYDPNLDKLSVYKIAADGTLSLQDSIAAPYVAADCAAGTTSNAQSNYCMVSGPEGTNAAGYVYVRFNNDCAATPCGAPSVHRYHLVSGQIVDAGTWNISAAVTGAVLGGVDIIAIDPTGTHFYVGSRQSNLQGARSSGFVLAAYAVGADGSLGSTTTAATLLPKEAEDVDGVTFYTKNATLYAYVVFHGTGVINSQTVPVSGLSDNLVSAQGGFVSITNSHIWDKSQYDISAIAINSQGNGSVYIAYARPSSSNPAITDVNVTQVPIKADGSLDLGSNTLMLDFDGAYVRDMSIEANGGLMFIAYHDVTAASGNWNNAHVATYSVETGGALSHVSTVDETVNGGSYVQSMALSADGARAYLPLPNQGVVNQYLIGATKGTVSPASQVVGDGSSASVTVTPNAGYQAVVKGCGGALASGTYTTAAVTADCEVTATFVAN